MSEEFPHAKAIFGRALEIESMEERSTYLNQACRGDERLRDHIEDLLRAIDDAGSFLERPVFQQQAFLPFVLGSDRSETARYRTTLGDVDSRAFDDACNARWSGGKTATQRRARPGGVSFCKRTGASRCAE
jgi:hypothetical protein